MNLKSFMIGATIGVVVVGGAWICTNSSREKEQQCDIINYNLSEYSNLSQNEKGIIEVISYQKKYQEEYKTENYEVVVKNTSGESLKKIQFTLGEGVYELYDMLPDEEYKFVAYNTEENLDLEIISIDYEIKNYYPEEISLEISNDGENINGSVTNNGQRELYPSQIIFFLKDNDGNTIQKTIEYAGCFFDGLVIKSEQSLEFESNIPQGYFFNDNKSVIVRYTDLDFRTVDTRFFN